MSTGPLPSPSKCKSGRLNVPGFPAMVMVFGVVSSEDHIMPPHIFWSRRESQHQINTATSGQSEPESNNYEAVLHIP